VFVSSQRVIVDFGVDLPTRAVLASKFASQRVRLRSWVPSPMLLLGSGLSAAAVSQWHEGCLCELKQTAAGASSDLAMPAIFGTSYFKQSGRVSQFCPCSIETVQRLNTELIMPRLLPLLNRTFFRYAKLDLERPCPFWDDSSSGSCMLRDCGVEACSEDEEQRLQQCGEEQALGLGEVQRTDAAALGAAAPSWDLGSTACTTSSTCEAARLGLGLGLTRWC
jgi:hypothetical protein